MPTSFFGWVGLLLDKYGALFLRGIEVGAAALVMLFGLGLLLGYVAAERVTCL